MSTHWGITIVAEAEVIPGEPAATESTPTTGEPEADTPEE